MQRSKVRKAWAAAIAVSLLVHLLILAVIFRDWSAGSPVFRETPIEVSLLRPEPSRREPPAPAAASLPPVRPASRPAASDATPFVAPIAEATATPVRAPPAAPTVSRSAPDDGLGKLAAPDPRRKDCKDAGIAEIFGSRLRECEYLIEEARAKSSIPLPARPLPAPLPDGGLDPKALAEFDKGKAMRDCLIPHPQGGCLKDKGLTFKRRF